MDGGPLFFEFGFGGVDFALAELVDGDVLDDFPGGAGAADGEGEHEAFFDAVGAIAANSDAGPVAGWGDGAEAADGVAGGIGSGGGGGHAAGLDDGGAALLDGGDEITLEPGVVGDDIGGGFAVDFGVVEVGILSGGVVAPDGDV